MDAVFVEMRDFTKWITRFLPDDVYRELQYALMHNPELGAVIPGCGGLRKVRVADPGKNVGKRSGVRVIYLHVPELQRFYMVDAYSKSEQADLTPAHKDQLAQLAARLKRGAKS